MGRGRLLAAAVAAFGFITPGEAATASPDIRGFWEHESCVVQERDGKKTGSRAAFAFFDREWGLSFTQFADEACTAKVTTAVLRGTYELTIPSRTVAGAHEATFRFDYRGVAVFDEGLLAKVGTACGRGPWVKGEERDVTMTGCLWLEPLSGCPQEYDLVSVQGRLLILGERPPAGRNICAPERRPTRLRTVPLVSR